MICPKLVTVLTPFNFSLGITQKQLTWLGTDNSKMNDSLLYMQSQSMRNNLIFNGISEDLLGKPDSTELKPRQFMVDKLKLAQAFVTVSALSVYTDLATILLGRVPHPALEALLLSFYNFKAVSWLGELVPI